MSSLGDRLQDVIAYENLDHIESNFSLIWSATMIKFLPLDFLS